MFRPAYDFLSRISQPKSARRSQATPPVARMEALEVRTLLSADVIGRAADGSVYVGHSDGTQFTNDLAGTIDPSVTGDFFYEDFNGDGLTDLLVLQENGPNEDTLYFRLMQDDGTFAPAQIQNIGMDFIDGNQQYLGVGDITGNGFNDLVFMDQDGVGPTLTQKVYTIRGGNFLHPPVFEVQRTMVAWDFHGLADVDGDNVVEVIARSPLNGGWFRSVGNAFHSFGGWTQQHDFENVMFGDFNGDGNDDVAGRIKADGRWLVGLSNGHDRFVSQLFGGWTTNQTFSDVQVGDFNGDGNDDVFGRAANGTLVVGLSNGTSRFVSQSFGALSTSAGFDEIFVADFNHDGLDDIATKSAGEAWVVGISDGTAFEKSVWLRWAIGTTWDLVGIGEFGEPIVV